MQDYARTINGGCCARFRDVAGRILQNVGKTFIRIGRGDHADLGRGSLSGRREVHTMTTEEIKATTTMKDVLARYGMSTNSRGFCSCCFHIGDRKPSMRVNDRFFYCFGCDTGGDIFKFVMLKEGCDFKTAFQILGGTYEHGSIPTERIRASRMIMNRKAAVQEYHDKVDALKEELHEANVCITLYRALLETVDLLL